jgi:hypothetical protein
VDPDPYSESGSGRVKMTHKGRQKNLRNFMFFEVLDVLFGELKASLVTWTSFIEAQG